RRVACAAGVCLAAMTALALGVRLEVRVESQQVVLRWGTPPAPPPVVVPSPVPATPGAGEERLRLLEEWVQLGAADARRRDERHQREMDLLRRQLQEVHEQAERDLTALYQAQFPAQKGIHP